jgi:hypothetical protein
MIHGLLWQADSRRDFRKIRCLYGTRKFIAVLRKTAEGVVTIAASYSEGRVWNFGR